MNMMKRSLVAISVLTPLIYSGCATLFEHSNSDDRYSPIDQKAGIYQGVRADLENAGLRSIGSSEWPYAFANILDLPFSAIADTLILPYDVINKQEQEAKRPPVDAAKRRTYDIKEAEQTSPANHRPFGTSGMAPADPASRAGATPEASGDS